MVLGLIPAHAGKTRYDGRSDTRSPAHPRSRGENTRVKLRDPAGVGSSPLTRGKLRGLMHRINPARLIPAHAGKTLTPTEWVTKLKAHPRSRGENRRRCDATDITTGSSPLTRGKLEVVVAGLEGIRLIPAHAGKTTETAASGRFRRAHPRSRGENALRVRDLPQWRGSSPLTRGKPRRTPGLRESGGLIPAHAGKTRPACQYCPTTNPHPRSRGENSSARKRPASASGSSPLTRGKHHDPGWDFLVIRLIPAHAGKTLAARGLVF